MQEMFGKGFIQMIEGSAIHSPKQVNYFIDKSLFIRELVSDNAKASLIMRPHKLCKTFNLQMTKEFLSPDVILIGYAFAPSFSSTTSSIYFRGGEKSVNGRVLKFHQLKIAENEQFCNKHQGQNPVLFLSLGSLCVSSFKRLRQSLENVLATAYLQQLHIAISLLCSQIGHAEAENAINAASLSLADSSHLLQIHKELIKLANQKGSKLSKASVYVSKVIQKRLVDEQFEKSLPVLIDMMKTFYNQRKVYVFVDDYDSAIIKLIKDFLFVHPDQRKEILQDLNQASRLIASMLKCISNSDAVQKLVLSGVSAILNNEFGLNFKVHGLDSRQYREVLGFSELQVKELLARMYKCRPPLISCLDGSSMINACYRWQYDDYHFFDPDSIIGYLQVLRTMPEGFAVAKDFWGEDLSSCIYEHLDALDDSTFTTLSTLIVGAPYKQRLDASKINLSFIKSLLTYNRIVPQKIAYYILEIDGYIFPAKVNDGKRLKKGYRNTNSMVGAKYKQEISTAWQAFYHHGVRNKRQQTYAVRCQDEPAVSAQVQAQILLSIKPQYKESSSMDHLERNSQFRSKIRKLELQTMFAARRQELLKEKEENEPKDK